MTSKDAGLRIRVQRDLRDQFLDACRAHDRPAAQVIREFMRSYVAAHSASPSGEEAVISGQIPKCPSGDFASQMNRLAVAGEMPS